jgi:transcriptional regulator with XRE-family HTH domain
MSNLNTALLSKWIKDKRGSKGLRETAKELNGVSHTTLARLENEFLPDVDTFIEVCKWLNVSTDVFTSVNTKSKEISAKKPIIAHLRADKLLSKKSAETLISLIELAYAELEKQPAKKK